jgi:hypothetical protein
MRELDMKPEEPMLRRTGERNKPRGGEKPTNAKSEEEKHVFMLNSTHKKTWITNRREWPV